ncbi:nucleotide sugar dehydrogenase [Halovivax ruber XH-70]|uniref:UDP-N-acetyl-D-mannosamine dehydrogenase n=1 Tax=Halovivax ruber (strain DSM 18193 / JCM 13892 / XH-70) TaxID=797302 RepID=L0IFA3_HALRX|nr:nucleotide sugar dehydrogenase [Halovivax ruber]AGB17439.1 nucleotide sugar dehydrogenase [Halovivax ruber XH-70]
MTERLESVEPTAAETASVCVVGLGYVGLPLAVALSEAGHELAGFDVDPETIETLDSGVDPTGDVGNERIDPTAIDFTTDPTPISDAEYVIVAVPTPIDDREKPDLALVESAGASVGDHLQRGATVVLESTVYPGATRERFVPSIERSSGLTAGVDFGVGYSPERMVPGDDEHGLANVVKIVSGMTEETLADVATLYESVVEAGVHRAPTIETAEAAKVVENTQRDLNIALVNELAIACDHLGLETEAVLEAAGTKWNFHDYRPGLVGGHCIPVDPFYLIYETEQNGFSPELIRKAREVNEYVPEHVAELTIRGLNEAGNVLRDSRVLVCGLSYKPNVADIRTSAIGGTIDRLADYGIDVVGFDPHADADAMREEFSIPVQETFDADGFDALLVGTPHGEFYGLPFDELASEMAASPVLVDVDGSFADRVPEDTYVYYTL